MLTESVLLLQSQSWQHCLQTFITCHPPMWVTLLKVVQLLC